MTIEMCIYTGSEKKMTFETIYTLYRTSDIETTEEQNYKTK